MKKYCGLVGPGLSVGVTGPLVTVYSLSVSLLGLLVIKIPDSRIKLVKVHDQPGKVTGLSGRFIDRLAKVIDCSVISPVCSAQSVCHHIQSRSPYLGQARCTIQTGLFY